MWNFRARCFLSEPFIELAQIEKEKEAIQIPMEEDVQSYYEIRKQIDTYSEDVRAVISSPRYCLPFMQPGRLVHIKLNGMDFDWGVLLNFHKRKTKESKDDPTSSDFEYKLDVMLYCSKDSVLSKDADGNSVGIKPGIPDEGTFMVSRAFPWYLYVHTNASLLLA